MDELVQVMAGLSENKAKQAWAHLDLLMKVLC